MNTKTHINKYGTNSNYTNRAISLSCHLMWRQNTKMSCTEQ